MSSPSFPIIDGPRTTVLKTCNHSARYRRIYLRILMVAIPLSLVCGVVGFYWYADDHKEGLNLFNAVYQSLQLFGMRTRPLTPPINPCLEAARWLALIASSATFLLILHVLLWGECRRIFLSACGRNHVVVCGLGNTGLPLALEFRRQGGPKRWWWQNPLVVAIEQDPNHPNIAAVEREGIIVLVGDARNQATLREAGVHRASRLVAVCSDENSNVAIITAAGCLAARRSSKAGKLECFFTVNDSRLRKQLTASGRFPNMGPRFTVKVGGVDLPEFHARHALTRYPLDFAGIPPGSTKRAHLIVVGCGMYGRALAIQGLQLAHFANEKPLRLTFIAPDASAALRELQGRHPRVASWYDFAARDIPWEDDSLVKTIVDQVHPDELVTVAFCCQSGGQIPDALDGWNLSLALGAREEFRERRKPAAGAGAPPPPVPDLADIQLLACLNSQAGFGTLLDPKREECASQGALSEQQLPAIHPIGLADNAINIETLLHERQDQLAQFLHQRYLMNEKRCAEKKQVKFPSKPSHRPWEDLDKVYRDSNRLSADHIDVKLRAFGMRRETAGQCAPTIESYDALKGEFGEKNTELLSRMEHSRWCAEKWLDGWVYGVPRSDPDKIQDALLPWNDLPRETQWIDKTMIEGMFVALKETGDVICRAPGSQAAVRGGTDKPSPDTGG